MFTWEIIELFANDSNSEKAYTIKAKGDYGTFFHGHFDTIDQALEAMQKLRDEVKSGL